MESPHDHSNDGQISPTYSFEVLDPHDPVISRLATLLFLKTNDYLQGEMVAGQEHYALLEEINRQGITKFADLRNFVSNLSKTMYEYEKLCDQQIKPLLEQIDQIEGQVSLVEKKAYILDSYTKQLYNLHKEVLDKTHIVPIPHERNKGRNILMLAFWYVMMWSKMLNWRNPDSQLAFKDSC